MLILLLSKEIKRFELQIKTKNTISMCFSINTSMVLMITISQDHAVDGQLLGGEDCPLPHKGGKTIQLVGSFS